MTMEIRPCESCIHRKPNGCESWECKYEPKDKEKGIKMNDDIERFDEANTGITWTIHGVIGMAEEHKGKFKDVTYMGNFHTHGLDLYGHRELCIVLNMPQEKAGELLNNMGLMISKKGRTFSEGIQKDVLQNDYDVELISFEDDPTLYVILPDVNNKFPSDADCEEGYNYQYEYARIISEDKGYV